MLPQIATHRPRGVVPKVAVRKRTVVEYQPSWLLLILPAVAVLVARRKKSRAQTCPARPEADANQPDAVTPTPRQRRRQLAVVRLARLRRRPASPPTVEVTDMTVPAPNNPGL